MQMLSEAFPIMLDNKGVNPDDNVKCFTLRIYRKTYLTLLNACFGRAWPTDFKCVLIAYILIFLSAET
jgi:hypothetical protein